MNSKLPQLPIPRPNGLTASLPTPAAVLPPPPRVKQHRAALAVLNQLLQQEPADWGAWTQAGLIQLQMGDAAAARRTFDHVAQQLGQQQSAASAVARPGGGGSSSSSGGSCSTGGDAAAAAAGRAVRRRRGLLLLVKGDYSGG